MGFVANPLYQSVATPILKMKSETDEEVKSEPQDVEDVSDDDEIEEVKPLHLPEEVKEMKPLPLPKFRTKKIKLTEESIKVGKAKMKIGTKGKKKPKKKKKKKKKKKIFSLLAPYLREYCENC